MAEEQTEGIATSPTESETPPAADEKGGGSDSEGNEFVEMPPEVDARFKRIYGNMKRYEGQVIALRDQNELLVDRVGRLINSQETAISDQHRQTLLAELKTAHENADFDAVVALTDKISEAKPAPSKPKAKAQPKSALPDDQLQTIAAWRDETDDEGKLKRPWAQQTHAKARQTASYASGVMESPEFAGAEMSEVLKEVDRLMGMETKQQKTVLTTNSAPKKTGKTTLTADEKEVARRMGLTNDQYAKNKEVLA